MTFLKLFCSSHMTSTINFNWIRKVERLLSSSRNIYAKTTTHKLSFFRQTSKNKKIIWELFTLDLMKSFVFIKKKSNKNIEHFNNKNHNHNSIFQSRVKWQFSLTKHVVVSIHLQLSQLLDWNLSVISNFTKPPSSKFCAKVIFQHWTLL